MSNPPKLCLVFRQLGYVFPRSSSQALPWARFSSLYLLFQPPLLQATLPQRSICWRSTHQKLGFLETGEGSRFIHSLTHLTEGQSSGGFPGGSVVKNLPANTGDAGYAGSVPGSWRRTNPLQYSCLGNSTDRGAWPAIVRPVAKSQTQLSD